MHPIIRFYLNDQSLKKELGFTHIDFLNGNDEWRESCHGHIQWAFPMEVPSMVLMQETPVLTSDVIDLFNNSGDLQWKLYESYNIMINFCGIKYDESKYAKWITPRNHNFLRLTRMIRSMRILGMQGWATILHDNLMQICDNPTYRAIIGEETINYWNAANVETFD